MGRILSVAVEKVELSPPVEWKRGNSQFFKPTGIVDHWTYRRIFLINFCQFKFQPKEIFSRSFGARYSLFRKWNYYTSVLLLLSENFSAIVPNAQLRTRDLWKIPPAERKERGVWQIKNRTKKRKLELERERAFCFLTIFRPRHSAKGARSSTSLKLFWIR